MLTAITGLLGGLLYPLFAIIFLLIDLLQGVFYGLAGIGDIGFNRQSSNSWADWFGNGQTIGSTNDGGETSTGLIYYLLTSPLIKNLFISIMLLALFLIIIFTAMAFIKNAYSAKQKNWQEIVGNAFKGLANFIFLPVCCLLGVWLSNILLLAINGATSTGGATKMSRKLFICCAYDANEYRNKTEVSTNDIADIKYLVETCDDVKVDFDENHSKTDVEYFANVVDTVYAQTSNFYANISWWGSVERHYSLFNFNYLVLIVGGVFMLYVLISVAYAMIKRMFILLMLFVVSPAICAMYPLDEGAAVGNWKKEFIKYTISAYGAIAAMNIFFSILPIIENIQIVSFGGNLTNDIFQLLIMASGLFVVKEFMGTLSGWIGGDNALATGESLRKSTKGAMDKYAKPAVKRTVGAFANMSGHIKSEGFWKGMRSSFADTMLGQKDDKGIRKRDGLLNFMSGGAHKEVMELADSTKDSFKYGKGAREKDEERALTKEFEDNTKANKKDFKAHVSTRWNDALDILDDNGNVVGINNIYGQTKTFIDNGKKAGLSDNEAKKLASQQLGLSLNDVEEYYEKGTKEKEKAKEKKAREEAAAENAAAMRGQAEASAMFNNVEAASVQVKASRLEVDAQDSVMKGLAGTAGANPALIAEMNRQVASGNFAKIPDAVLPTDSMTVADIDLLEKWNTKMDKIAGVNDKYRESLNKLQSVAESVASKLEGVDTELTNFKNDMKDATKTVADLDKSADDLAKAMSQAVNEGKKKGSGGSTP